MTSTSSKLTNDDFTDLERVSSHAQSYITTNALPPNSSSLLTNDNKIQVNLEFWIRFANEPVETCEQQNLKVRRMISFFIGVAQLNNLNGTEAVDLLQQNLKHVLANKRFPKMDETNWRDRISQMRQIVRVAVNFRQAVIRGFPLANMWDAIALIYSLCIDVVPSGRYAQFHLLQFRFMLGGL